MELNILTATLLVSALILWSVLIVKFLYWLRAVHNSMHEYRQINFSIENLQNKHFELSRRVEALESKRRR